MIDWGPAPALLITYDRIGPHVEGDVIEVAVTVTAGSEYQEDVNVIAAGGTVTYIFTFPGEGANEEKTQTVAVPLEHIEGEIVDYKVRVKNKDEESDNSKGNSVIEMCDDKPC